MDKLKMSETMTEVQALRVACESYAPGELVSATKMYHDTLEILRASGYEKKMPLQGTISRRYRPRNQGPCRYGVRGEARTIPSQGTNPADTGGEEIRPAGDVLGRAEHGKRTYDCLRIDTIFSELDWTKGVAASFQDPLLHRGCNHTM